jgi:tetratricopeptide (TPR) repeat protein
LLSFPSLAFLYAEMGRFEESLALIEDAREQVDDIEQELRYIGHPRAMLLLRMGRASDALEWVREIADGRGVRLAQLYSLTMSARSLAALDSLDAARAVVAKLRSQENSWGGYALVIGYTVDAEIALREGKPEAALYALRRLKQHAMPFGSLYDIVYREQLARCHLMDGRLEDAAAVHEEMTGVYGGHALSYYELGRIYEEMGRTGDAARSTERFLEMWSKADEGLPQLADARERVTRLRTRL